MRSLALFVAIGSMALLSSGSVGALPIAAAESVAAVESNLLLVRDGCGRGWHFSDRRQACVEDYDSRSRYYSPPPPPPPRYYSPPPPRVVIPLCPPGQRFSNSRQACVWR